MTTARLLVMAILCASGAVSCAETPTITFDEYHGGSRLKPRVFFGDDGSKGIIGWRDAKLDFDCDFERVAGGMVCLKAAAWTFTSYYVDAACTIPASTEGTAEVPVRVDTKRRGVYKPTAQQASTCYLFSGTGCDAIPDCDTGTRPLYETQEITDFYAYAAEITGQ